MKHIKNLDPKSNFFSYETYIFDFDGTLVLSNQIKRDGFDIIAKEYDNGIEIIAEIIKNNKNANRYLIFDKFVNFFDIFRILRLHTFLLLLFQFQYTIKEIDPNLASI